MIGIADNAFNCTWGGRNTSRLPYPPATCKRRELDGVAVFCEAMKGDGVMRLRKEEIAGQDKGCEAEGGVYRRLRSLECQCASEGAGLAVYFASAVTER